MIDRHTKAFYIAMIIYFSGSLLSASLLAEIAVREEILHSNWRAAGVFSGLLLLAVGWLLMHPEHKRSDVALVLRRLLQVAFAVVVATILIYLFG